MFSTNIDSWDTATNKADKGLTLKEFLFLQRGCRQKIHPHLREEDTGVYKRVPEEFVDIPVGELREIMLELRSASDKWCENLRKVLDKGHSVYQNIVASG